VTAIALALAALTLATIPAWLFLSNLRHYRPPPPWQERSGRPPAVSVLIPARNEEESIVACVESALASRGVDLEVIVLDDHSEDATGRLVADVAARDPRLRLVTAPPLPAGWCGKQHACAVLAREARHDLLAFLDADVRFEPEGLARMLAFRETSGADLVSGIPRQVTGTWAERLVLPLIHFVLLGFLPIRRMRASRSPAYGAGCGQLFLCRRPAYEQAGGHAAIRATLHDGIKLPRVFRAAGLQTDLCDATAVAWCRMYHGAGEVWRGLAKNATEGLAAPALLVPASLLLLGGQVLPFVLLGCGALLPPAAVALCLAACAAAYAPRLVAAARFRQSLVSALLHPLGILFLTAIQWYAAARALFGASPTWKGRSYAA
jgi:hypothetical protein